jgi:lipoate-protein ligase A
MWERHLVGGTVAELHERELPLDRRSVWVMEATVPTLVFGSAQRDGLVDDERAERAGWATARRRSGGGLVALDPAEVVWIDVVVPRGDTLWSDDVGAAFGWLGDAWVRALASMGLDAVAHRGGAVRPEQGRVICFAGVGTGEVSVGDDKLVGLSQRRTREGARFQCLVHLSWEPERWWPVVRGAVPPDLAQDIDPTVADRVAWLGHVDDQGSEVRDLLVAALMGQLLALEHEGAAH